MNGRVWVNSPSEAHTVIIVNAILNSEFMTERQAQTMVDALVAQLA
jgi:exosome complex component RRP40